MGKIKQTKKAKEFQKIIRDVVEMNTSSEHLSSTEKVVMKIFRDNNYIMPWIDPERNIVLGNKRY